MALLGGLFARSSREEATNPEVGSSSEPEAERASEPEAGVRSPTDRLTGFQIFYIFGLDGIGAMVLSGGINFAVAYALYAHQDTEKSPIRLFELPNTLAGDAAVTLIVQCLITWLVELVLVSRDMQNGMVAPIGFVAEPENRLLRWFLFLDCGDRLHEPGTAAHRARFLASQLLRVFVVFVASFCLFWGPSVGILTAVGHRRGGDWYFERTWAPQVFKLILGGLLALVTSPLFAIFWLVRCGWAVKRGEKHYGER